MPIHSATRIISTNDQRDTAQALSLGRLATRACPRPIPQTHNRIRVRPELTEEHSRAQLRGKKDGDMGERCGASRSRCSAVRIRIISAGARCAEYESGSAIADFTSDSEPKPRNTPRRSWAFMAGERGHRKSSAGRIWKAFCLTRFHYHFSRTWEAGAIPR